MLVSSQNAIFQAEISPPPSIPPLFGDRADTVSQSAVSCHTLCEFNAPRASSTVALKSFRQSANPRHVRCSSIHMLSNMHRGREKASESRPDGGGGKPWARFQTPSRVSFLPLIEFRGESSVSSSQPLICVPKQAHRVFRRTHRVWCRTQ